MYNMILAGLTLLSVLVAVIAIGYTIYAPMGLEHCIPVHDCGAMCPFYNRHACGLTKENENAHPGILQRESSGATIWLLAQGAPPAGQVPCSDGAPDAGVPATCPACSHDDGVRGVTAACSKRCGANPGGHPGCSGESQPPTDGHLYCITPDHCAGGIQPFPGCHAICTQQECAAAVVSS
jgi:hypothetical protein